MHFNAVGPTTMLTISSSGYNSCGPVIDDVRVSHFQRPRQFSSSKRVNSILLGATLAAAVVFVAPVVGLVFLWRRRQKSRALADLTSGSQVEHKVKVYSYSELQKATAEWSTTLGRGGFSTVYRAEFPDGLVGAVKVEKNKEFVEGSLFREELSVLLRVNHRYLVNIIGFCADKDHPILVFEYLPNGTLYQRLHTDKPPGLGILSWPARMKIIFQVSCALEYLHHGTSPPIVHRDIKSANILLTATDSAKLADFGLSKSAPADASAFQTVQTDVRGSLGYLDPKYLRSGVYSIKSDVYSYGVLLLEIISGHTAIKDMDLLTYWAARTFIRWQSNLIWQKGSAVPLYNKHTGDHFLRSKCGISWCPGLHSRPGARPVYSGSRFTIDRILNTDELYTIHSVVLDGTSQNGGGLPCQAFTPAFGMA